MDWLSRLFEVMPVRGRLDLRCSYGAPWRIDQDPARSTRSRIMRLSADRRYLEIRLGGGRRSWRAGPLCRFPENPRPGVLCGGGGPPRPPQVDRTVMSR